MQFDYISVFFLLPDSTKCKSLEYKFQVSSFLFCILQWGHKYSMLNSLGSRPILLAQFASEHDSRARFRFIASKKASFLFKASSIRKRKREHS